MDRDAMSLIVALAGALVAGRPQLAFATSPDETNVSSVVVKRLKESLNDNWGKLSAWCKRTTDLRDELDSLPDSAWFGADKKLQRELIHDKVMQIRKLLLSTNAQEIMKGVDKLDERIADIDKDIDKENAKSVFCPAKGDNASLLKLREKRRNLMRQREDAVRIVMKEVEALGLRLSGGGAEQCLFMVDARDLIDAVVIAKNIGMVVENLRALMTTGNVAAAKRYFGMYLTLVEVQKTCFDVYLDNCRNGKWREKLVRMETDASELRQKALKSSQDMSFSEHQRTAFKRNVEVNEATLNAVGTYKKILSQHVDVIQAKADEAARMLLVAENSYLTVSLTDVFLSLIKANQDSFEALLQLQLPPIEIFSDTALQTEFATLTKRLTAAGVTR